MPTKRLAAATGFTIIEIMMVLAVAGIILLLVIEAIPALVRNSRNNQRKQDVALILQAVSHYELNHSGNIPDQSTLRADLSNTSPHLTNYRTGSITVAPIVFDATTSIPVNNTTVDQVKIFNHAKCDPSSYGNATDSGAGYNDVVALFSIESSNPTPSPHCQQL